MLYFSESGWTVPDMVQVNAEFDRDYDQNEYEQKIGCLVRAIEARQDRSQDEIESWNDALVKLSDEDHYLLVLVNITPPRATNPSWLPTLESGSRRPPGDRMKLILTAVAVVAVLFIVGGFWMHFADPK